MVYCVQTRSPVPLSGLGRKHQGPDQICDAEIRGLNMEYPLANTIRQTKPPSSLSTFPYSHLKIEFYLFRRPEINTSIYI